MIVLSKASHLKLLSTAAAVLTCSNVLCSTGFSFPCAAADTQMSEPVSVIVQVTGDAVLDGADSPDYIETRQAAAETARAERAQAAVQKQIRMLFPTLEPGYSYSTLFNGFSCELPENLIDAVSALPGVADVYRIQNHNVPKMATAASLSGFPAYYDATGCTGEGQVIAVIDSELDTDHPMFSALSDDIETKLSKDDITEIASGVGFNTLIDPERAYLSSKLPYVVDYVDDPHDGVPNPYDYHGTHVSGIAAGNAFEDANGRKVSGIARDAQLIFMAVGVGNNQMNDDAILAALEDAVKLKADVVNMSFGADGENFGPTPLAAAINSAEALGVSVCMAAGNSDNGATVKDGLLTPDNPDTSTMNKNAPKGTKCMVVASADNAYTEYMHTMSLGEELIGYVPCADASTHHEYYIDEMLTDEPYEYVYCGLGYAEDFAGKDLTGKLALVDRGELDFVEKNANAADAGAVGVIVMNNEEGMPDVPVYESGLLFTIISAADGRKLMEAEDKVVRFTDERIEVTKATAVSDYSSWGVSESLELRPDIMGIGGEVLSACYDNDLVRMNGTSMACPYLSGCTAVLNEYLNQNGCELTGEARAQYIRRLLMTSAEPYTEDDMYVTPRRQGAGFVSMNRALEDKVLLTGDDGECKINLYDNLGTEFSFPVTLRNLSDEEVHFDSARLVLTTDGTAPYSNDPDITVISGQTPLTCSADLNSLQDIAANETRTETVSVQLLASQTEKLKETFVNGFFVEGYLLLEDSENCCDISIPLLGFFGDWAAVPIIPEQKTGYAMVNMGAIQQQIPFTQIVSIVYDIMNRVTDEEFEQYGDSYAELIREKATDAERELLFGESDVLYVSPNGDGLADKPGLLMQPARHCMISNLEILDSKDETVMDSWTTVYRRNVPYLAEPTADLRDLPEGSYTGRGSAVIDYPTSFEHPQEFSVPFIIDKTAPQIKTEEREENGRRILKMTVSDAALDGIIVTGQGNGSLAGTEPEPPVGMPDKLYAFSIVQQVFGAQDLFQVYAPDRTPESLPGRLLSDCLHGDELNELTFADVIPAKQDENGQFTFEYDITDLTSYSFTVMDRAMNTAAYESPAVPEDAIPQNTLYMGRYGFYHFTGEQMIFNAFEDKSELTYACTYQDGKLMLTDAAGNTQECDVRNADSSGYRLTGDISDTIYPQEQSPDEIFFYSVEEVRKAAEKQMTKVYPFTKIEARLIEDATALIIGYVNFGQAELPVYYLKADLLTGLCAINETQVQNLFEEPVETIPAGWFVGSQDFELTYFLFREDGTGLMVQQRDKSELPFSYVNQGEGIFTLTIGEDQANVAVTAAGTEYYLSFADGSVVTMKYLAAEDKQLEFYSTDELTEMTADYEEAVTGLKLDEVYATETPGGDIMIETSHGVTYMVNPFTAEGYTSNGDTVNLTKKPVLPKNAYDIARLGRMAKKDYEKRTGAKPADSFARMNSDGTVSVTLRDDMEDIIDVYTVDPVSGQGTTETGEAVDLPQTGITAPDTIIAAGFAFLLLTAGMYIMLRSGAMRRIKRVCTENTAAADSAA